MTDLVFLTGARGVVGTALQVCLKARERQFVCAGHTELQKMSAEDLIAHLDGCSHLIHCASNTDVEGCEANPDMASNDILTFTQTLAKAASAVNCKIIYLSSTGVYGDSTTLPNCESQAPKPTTVHHTFKYAAEQACSTIQSTALIIRTGWVFGTGINDNKNFIKKISSSAKQHISLGHTTIAANPFQFGNPTYNLDLANAILELMDVGASGIVNCTNTNSASRLEYVTEIIQTMGLDIEVTPLTTPPQRLAKVANNEMANNLKLKSQFGIALPNWETSLRSYVNSL